MVVKHDVGEYEPGTVCELFRLLELLLVRLGELELRVAVRRLITLVDEDAVEVIGSCF